MRDPKKEERLLREVRRAQWSAVAQVRGLFRAAGEAGFNPDALANWQDCSMRTRAALILTQGVMAAERAKQQATAPKTFGVVLIQERVESHQAWEQMASAVTEGKVIDAVAIPAPAKEEPS